MSDLITEYWSQFDAAYTTGGFKSAPRPPTRNKKHVRWAGLAFGFEIAAHAPRVRIGTHISEMSVELIRDHKTANPLPPSIVAALFGAVPRLSEMLALEFKIYQGSAQQTKIDVSAPAIFEDRDDWQRQHDWLISGAMKLWPVADKFLASLK